MNIDLIEEIEEKKEKTEAEVALLHYHEVFSMISEILVSESKSHVSSEKAINEIRDCIRNL